MIVGELFGKGWTDASAIGGHPWTHVAVSFAFFWVLQMALIWRGIERPAPVRELGGAAGHGRVRSR